MVQIKKTFIDFKDLDKAQKTQTAKTGSKTNDGNLFDGKIVADDDSALFKTGSDKKNTTQALGETGKYSTQAVGEEGGGSGKISKNNKETGGGSYSTQALGEEGGSTSQAVGEEGGTMTTLIVGEEGGANNVGKNIKFKG